MKNVYYDGDTFERGGILFRVNIEDDDTCSPPWEMSDGHGPVSDWTTRDKRPGEWVLNSDRGSKRYYDAAEANRIAKRDQWGIGPEAEAQLARKLGRAPTAGETRAAAVLSDYEFLRRWCNDQWSYVGVIVTPIPRDEENPQDVPTEYASALWGIESDAYEYIAEVAHELADEVISQRRATWRRVLADAREAKRAALVEKAAREYWASRDVMTV